MLAWLRGTPETPSIKALRLKAELAAIELTLAQEAQVSGTKTSEAQNPAQTPGVWATVFGYEPRHGIDPAEGDIEDESAQVSSDGSGLLNDRVVEVGLMERGVRALRRTLHGTDDEGSDDDTPHSTYIPDVEEDSDPAFDMLAKSGEVTWIPCTALHAHILSPHLLFCCCFAYLGSRMLKAKVGSRDGFQFLYF